METYSKKTGREADFIISYEWIEQEQKLFQHIRSDFMYAVEDGKQAWCVWPEFVDENLNIIKDVPNTGLATMWILNNEKENLIRHSKRIRLGMNCYLVVGTNKIATAKVLEIYNKSLLI